jgi:hypothetical protein
MSSSIKFKVIPMSLFVRKYDEANDELQAEDITTLPPKFGELQVNGTWHPCVLNEEGTPQHWFKEGTWMPISAFIKPFLQKV